jgi:hypothetical protein
MDKEETLKKRVWQNVSNWAESYEALKKKRA